ncbi:MAG: sugar transferase [Ilumatobacter sp.]|nr:sugar transferase [Ilumatobacter sp.]
MVAAEWPPQAVDERRRAETEVGGDVDQSVASLVEVTSAAADAHHDPMVPRAGVAHVKARLMLADAAAVLVGIIVAATLQRMIRPVPSWIVSTQLLLVLASAPGFALGAARNRIYQARTTERRGEEARRIANTVAISIATMLTLTFAVQYAQMSRLWVMLLSASMLGALLVERALARRIFARLRLEGRLVRKIVIVGTDAHAIGLMHTYHRSPALGYRVVGFAGDDSNCERAGVPVLGAIDRLPELLERHGASGVVVSLASVPHDQVNVLARKLTDDGYHVALSSCLSDIDVTRLRPQELDGRTMIYVEPTIRDGWRAVAKRVYDIALASTILLVTLPVIVVAAIAIRLDSPGPILYRQQRVGKDGHIFRMTKLRTMVVDAEQQREALLARNEASGPLFKIADDPRITRVGRILRKLSIDELPQLWTVLQGTMSMVGPRPALPEEAAAWDGDLSERLRVLPGLTGMWQVSGRSDVCFDEYRRYDLYYVDNWSLGHDIRICFRTVGVVLSGRGAA